MFGSKLLLCLLGAFLSVSVPGVIADNVETSASLDGKTTALSSTQRRELARLLLKKKGIFPVNSSLAAEFPALKNTVLVTYSNIGYYGYYKNWDCFLKELGMQHVLFSADSNITEKVGPGESLQVQEGLTDKQTFLSDGFRALTCKKLESVRWVLELGISVIFSDSDNVFRDVPRNLLQEISRGQYDALFQADHFNCTHRDSPSCLQENFWKSSKVINSGFYYFSARKRTQAVEFLSKTYELCNRPPTLLCCDDQQAINVAVRQIDIHPEQTSAKSFKKAEYCAYEPGRIPQNENEETLHWCLMDPEAHPAGKHKLSNSMVSWHANWIVSRSAKLDRLKKLGLWQYEAEGDKCVGAARKVFN